MASSKHMFEVIGDMSIQCLFVRDLMQRRSTKAWYASNSGDFEG